MLATADRHDVVAGVVGWAPLADRPATEAALDRYRADARFRGVRHLNHEELDPDWLVRPDVLDGLTALAERDLTFDVVATIPRHLEHVPALAERHPGLRIVIDHLAKPPIAERGWQPWADLMGRAAEHPNVYAKVSGLNTAARAGTWTAGDLRPYVELALERFGAQRLMYGGDWPVAILNGDYASVFAATEDVLAGCDRAEREAVFGATAVSFYGLAVHEPAATGKEA
jgi:L-fuconolactonase